MFRLSEPNAVETNDLESICTLSLCTCVFRYHASRTKDSHARGCARGEKEERYALVQPADGYSGPRETGKISSPRASHWDGTCSKLIFAVATSCI